MKVNILSNFFVIIAYYRYPLTILNVIVAVFYNLSNSEDLSAKDGKGGDWDRHLSLLRKAKVF